MVFDTKIPAEFNKLLVKAHELKGRNVEIKEKRKSRSVQQNRALHLLFDMAANELNGAGIPFVYTGLKGLEFEIQWTGELFKEVTWKPIQEFLYKTKSTTELTSPQIDRISEALNKFFGERGITITFPKKIEEWNSSK